jgi:hypothetical protein
MLFSVSGRHGRRAALILLLWGTFAALTPLAAFATGTVTLAWDPSEGTNVIANYNVYYGVASATYTNVAAAGTNLTVSISNLVEGATYFFAATAVDTSGLESDYSTEVSTLIPIKTTNQPPTLNTLADMTINENAGQQTVNLSGITSGATNEVQTLTVTASSSNTGLIPTPMVNYTSPNSTGSISFTPAGYAYGSAIITVTVDDGGVSNNIISRTFTVTVNPVNQPPTLNTLADITLNENAGQQTVNLSGITSGATSEPQTLTVTASSSNTGLIPTPTVTYTSPNTTGSIRFTPVANAYGASTITVTVNDGGASNNIVSRAFTVTVSQVNTPPTIASITNRIIAVDTATPAIPFTVGDFETPAANLTLSGNSDNPTLVLPADIVFGGSNSNRTVTVRPEPGQTGVANITITVSDGTDTASSVFQLSVRLRPAPPGGMRIASTGP